MAAPRAAGAAALLTFLLVRNVGDEGDRSGVDTTNDRAGSTAGQSGTGQTGTGQAAASPTTGPPAPTIRRPAQQVLRR
jgi:hypothetical protein